MLLLQNNRLEASYRKKVLCKLAQARWLKQLSVGVH